MAPVSCCKYELLLGKTRRSEVVVGIMNAPQVTRAANLSKHIAHTQRVPWKTKFLKYF